MVSPSTLPSSPFSGWNEVFLEPFSPSPLTYLGSQKYHCPYPSDLWHINPISQSKDDPRIHISTLSKLPHLLSEATVFAMCASCFVAWVVSFFFGFIEWRDFFFPFFSFFEVLSGFWGLKCFTLPFLNGSHKIIYWMYNQIRNPRIFLYLVLLSHVIWYYSYTVEFLQWRA